MRKTAILLMLILLCGAVLPAHAGMTEEEIASDIAAVLSEQRDTVFRIAAPSGHGVNRWVNYLFEKSHPGVRVEYAPYEPFAFETELIADPSRFDMIVTDRPEVLHAQDLCMDVYGITGGGWPEHLLDMRSLCEAKDGTLMGLPVFVNMEGLRFNRALAEEYGIKAPDKSYTWKDLVPLCEQVAELRLGGANVYLMAGPQSPDSVMDSFTPMMNQYLTHRAGQTPLRVDENEVADLLDTWKALRGSEAVKPFAEGAGEAFYENVLLTEAYFDPRNMQLGLLPMPGLYPDAPTRIGAAYLLCGNTASRQPELVRDYLALYMSEEGQRYASETLCLSKKIPEKQVSVLQEGARAIVFLDSYLLLMDEEGQPIDPPYTEEQMAQAQAMRSLFTQDTVRLTVSKDLYQAWISGLARFQSGKITAKEMADELNAKISLIMGD